jgi:hypothetical protein
MPSFSQGYLATITGSGAGADPPNASPPLSVYEVDIPRCIVIINGVQYIPESVTLELNAHGATNTASFTLPISSTDDFSQTLFEGTQNPNQINGLTNYYSLTLNQATKIAKAANANNAYSLIDVEVWGDNVSDATVMLTKGNLKSLFQGYLDSYTATFQDNKVEFSARSQASPLVDSKVTGISLNDTITSYLERTVLSIGGQSVVFNLANPGAPATVQEVLAKELVGGSQSNINNAIYGKSIWDLAKQGALFDNCDLWEDSTTGQLHYEDPRKVVRNTVNIHWNSTIATAVGMHSISQSRQVKVNVRTYNRRSTVSTSYTFDPSTNTTSDPVTRIASSSIVPGTAGSTSSATNLATGKTSISSKSSSGGAENAKAGTGTADSTIDDNTYTFYFPGLSPDRVTLLAQGLWRSISMHEYHVTIEAPMTAYFAQNLKITSVLNLANFPYNAWNGLYYPRRITTNWSVTEGWKFTVEAITIPESNGGV